MDTANSETETETLLKHQEDAVAVLADSLDLFHQALRQRLRWSSRVGGEEAAVEAMDGELVAVRDGDLRLPVVAPMKAGKSTIINSLIGYDLLPSRVAAMTALPTRIYLDQRMTWVDGADPSPVLELHEADVAKFATMVSALSTDLPQQRDQVVNQFPHLEELVDSIIDGSFEPVVGRVVGRAKVRKQLSLLNDLVRLAVFVTDEPGLYRLREVPKVFTPYWSPVAFEGNGPGRLVIVDNPGHDEAVLTKELADTVSRELQRSHVVLVVLDYTRMGSVVDAEVRTLMKPIVDVLGAERLFAVVNKIDQRKDTDLDNEGVTQYVRNNLDMADAGASDRIYPTAAERGLQAVRVLADLERYGDALDVTTNEPANSLMTLMRPMEWTKGKSTVALDDLRGLAELSWERSGLGRLIVHAVLRLRAEAMPLVIGAALTKFGAELNELEQAVGSRISMLGQEAEQIERAARLIALDMARVTEFKQSRGSALAVAKSVERKVEKVLTDAEREAKEFVERMNVAERVNATPAPEPRGGLGLLWRKLAEQRSAGNTAEISYASQVEAESIIAMVTVPVVERLRTIFAQAHHNIEAAVLDEARAAVATERAKVQGILDQAADRLKEGFAIEFAAPPLELRVPPLAEVSATAETKTEQKAYYYETTEQKWTLKFWKGRVPVTKIHKGTRTETTYVVKVGDILEELRGALRDQVRHLKSGLAAYTAGELEKYISTFYRDVEAYLQRFVDLLAQSLKDQQLEETERYRLTEDLTRFLADVSRVHKELSRLASRFAADRQSRGTAAVAG